MANRRDEAAQQAIALTSGYTVVNTDTGEGTASDLKAYTQQVLDRYFAPKDRTYRESSFNKRGVKGALQRIASLPDTVAKIADASQPIQAGDLETIKGTLEMLVALEEMVKPRADLYNKPEAALKQMGLSLADDDWDEQVAKMKRNGNRETAILEGSRKLIDGFKAIADQLAVDGPAEGNREVPSESVTDLAQALMRTEIEPKLAQQFLGHEPDGIYTVGDFLKDVRMQILENKTGIDGENPEELHRALLTLDDKLHAIVLMPDWLEKQNTPEHEAAQMNPSIALALLVSFQRDIPSWIDEQTQAGLRTQEFLGQSDQAAVDQKLNTVTDYAVDKAKKRGLDIPREELAMDSEQARMQMAALLKSMDAARKIFTDSVAPQLNTLSDAITRDIRAARNK